jgi:hypothetical protein
MPKKTALIDLSHNEMLNIYDEEFSEFLQLLKSLNLKVRTNENKNITEKQLQEIDILIIGNPIDNYFSSIEIKSIIDFVRKGGNLLLISEYGADHLQKTNLNDISGKYFGIYFQKNIVKKFNNINQNCDSILTVQDFGNHITINQLRDIILGGSCSLLINNNSEPLFYSNESWTEVYNDLTNQWSKDEDNIQHILAGCTKYGRGKVLAIGDIDIFSNDLNIGLSLLDNRKFVLNLFSWFLEPVKEKDVLGWILNQLGGIQNNIKDINNKINNLIETSTVLEKRISMLEEKPEQENSERKIFSI